MTDESVTELTEAEIAIAQGREEEDPGTAKEGGGEGKEAPPEAPPETPEPDGEAETEAPTEGEPEEASAGESDSESDAPKEPSAWITDEVRGLAQSYGLTEQDLGEFSGPDEFHRQARFFDGKLLGAPPSSPPTGQQPEPEKKTEISGLIDVAKYKEEGYDELSISWAESHNKLVEDQRRMEGVFNDFIQQVQEAERQQYANVVHDYLDQMDEGRYGRSANERGNTLKLSPEQIAARTQVFDMAASMREALVNQAQQAGREPVIPPLVTLLQRADNYCFATENRERDRKQIQEQLAKQAKKRRPVSARPKTVPAPKEELKAPQTEEDYIVHLVNDPELTKHFEELQEKAA